MNPKLLEILCCPESGQKLVFANPELVDRLNKKIKEGEIFSKDGEKVEKTLETALIRKDGKYIFPIVNSIPVMLMSQAILID